MERDKEETAFIQNILTALKKLGVSLKALCSHKEERENCQQSDNNGERVQGDKNRNIFSDFLNRCLHYLNLFSS